MSSSPHWFTETFKFFVQHEGFRRDPIRRTARAFGWIVLRALRKTPTVRIDRWGALYRLPRIARGPAKVFYVFEDDYEPEVRIIESLLTRDAVFVDVGANFGLFTVMASRLIGDSGRVLAFEPYPPAATDLAINVQFNECQNVVIHQCALSNCVGTADLFVHDDPGRNTLGDLGLPGGKKVSVPLAKLDDILRQEQITRLDFIKMDVEGAEELVLGGAVEALRTFQPLVAFEMTQAGPPRFGLDPFGPWRFLSKEGYRFFDFTMNGLVPIDAPASANTLGVPKGYTRSLPIA
jgi:FkbM family methyltransferase